MEVNEKEAKEVLDKIKREALAGKGELTERDLDGLEVKGKNGKRYRWINAKGMNVDRKAIEGWKVCTDPDVKGGMFQNGVHKNGDLILAELPEEDFQKKAAKNRERQKRLEKAVQEDFHEQGRKLQVETFEEVERR